MRIVAIAGSRQKGVCVQPGEDRYGFKEQRAGTHIGEDGGRQTLAAHSAGRVRQAPGRVPRIRQRASARDFAKN